MESDTSVRPKAGLGEGQIEVLSKKQDCKSVANGTHSSNAALNNDELTREQTGKNPKRSQATSETHAAFERDPETERPIGSAFG